MFSSFEFLLYFRGFRIISLLIILVLSFNLRGSYGKTTKKWKNNSSIKKGRKKD